MSSTARYVRWQDGDMWLGYFEQFTDYLTQGEFLCELEENLRDLYRDLRFHAIVKSRISSQSTFCEN